MTIPSKKNSKQLTYTLTFEDWLEFTLDSHQQVPSMRRMKKFSHYAIGTVYLGFGLIVVFVQREMLFGISFLFLSLAWFMLFPRYHRRRTIKHLQKLMKNGGDSVLSEHVLDFDEKALHITREGQSSTIEWSSFEHFVINEQRVYLKLGPLNGLIVPRSVAGIDDFIRACQQHIATPMTTS
jgi:hypothetical protein